MGFSVKNPLPYAVFPLLSACFKSNGTLLTDRRVFAFNGTGCCFKSKKQNVCLRFAYSNNLYSPDRVFFAYTFNILCILFFIRQNPDNHIPGKI